MIRLALIFGSFFSFFSIGFAQSQIDLKEIETKLKGDGVVGWIHGSVKDRSLYVFTFRNPKNFFDSVQFPMVGQNQGIRDQLKKFKRNDQVSIKGEFLENDAPIPHIQVSEIVLVKALQEPKPLGDYPYKTEIPKELIGKTEVIARVHAVAEEGKVTVVEIGDQVVPVFADDNRLTKDLYRGDKIRLKYVLQKKPHEPTHVRPNVAVDPNIEVLDKIVEQHGKKATLDGHLVLFTKSPQINMDVYALQIIDAEGTAIQYTLVNFDDAAVFQKIRDKLEAFWKAHESTAVNGRNKWSNRQIKIRATGTLNVVSPSQANPQIFLEGPDSIELQFVSSN